MKEKCRLLLNDVYILGNYSCGVFQVGLLLYGQFFSQTVQINTTLKQLQLDGSTKSMNTKTCRNVSTKIVLCNVMLKYKKFDVLENCCFKKSEFQT